MQVPAIQRLRSWPVRRGPQLAGLGMRAAELQTRAGRAPIGGEHLIAPPLAVQDLAGRVQQRSVEGADVDALLLQTPPHPRFCPGGRGLRDGAHHHLGGLGAADDVRHGVRQIAPGQHQARALGLQRRSQGPQRLVQPPPAGAAQGPHALALVQHKERDHWPPARRRGGHGGIVRQPQVAAEEQDDRGVGAGRTHAIVALNAASRAKAKVSALRRAGARRFRGDWAITAPSKPSATISPGPSASTWRGNSGATAK